MRKATCIVRPVDDLGRVVIPKEIRRTQRIRDKDKVEIFTGDNGQIIIEKYMPMGVIGDIAKDYAHALSSSAGLPVLICDNDKVLAYSGTEKDVARTSLSDQCHETREQRRHFACTDKDYKPMCPLQEELTALYGRTILSDSDAVGSIFLLQDKKNPQSTGAPHCEKLLITAADFLGQQV